MVTLTLQTSAQAIKASNAACQILAAVAVARKLQLSRMPLRRSASSIHGMLVTTMVLPLVAVSDDHVCRALLTVLGCDGYNDCNRVGFDCSGLTKYAVYQATGISLPHYTGSQYTHPNCKRIPLASASTGDLLFWRSAGSSNAADAHVAILQDSKTLIEAYDTQDGVIRDARRGSTSGETIEPYACRFWTS